MRLLLACCLALVAVLAVGEAEATYTAGFGLQYVEDHFDDTWNHVWWNLYQFGWRTSRTKSFCSAQSGQVAESDAWGSGGDAFVFDFNTRRAAYNHNSWRPLPPNDQSRNNLRMGGRVYWRWLATVDTGTMDNGCSGDPVPNNGPNQLHFVADGITPDYWQVMQYYEVSALTHWTWATERVPFDSITFESSSNGSNIGIMQRITQDDGDHIAVDDVVISCENQVENHAGDVADYLLYEPFDDDTLHDAWDLSHGPVISSASGTITTGICGGDSLSPLAHEPGDTSYYCFDRDDSNGDRYLLTDPLDFSQGATIEYWFRNIDANAGQDLQVLWQREGDGFGWRPLRSYTGYILVDNAPTGLLEMDTYGGPGWHYEIVGFEPQPAPILFKFVQRRGPFPRTLNDDTNAWALDQVTVRRNRPRAGVANDRAIEVARLAPSPAPANTLYNPGAYGKMHDVSRLSTITTELTIEVMLKLWPEAASGSNAVVAKRNSATDNEIDWELRVANDVDASQPGHHLRFEVVSENTGARWITRMNVPLETDRWYAVAGVVRHTNGTADVELWLDGQQLLPGELTVTSAWDSDDAVIAHSATDPLQIGWRPVPGSALTPIDDAYWRKFYGSLDELRVWNRALSPDELLGFAFAKLPDPSVYEDELLVMVTFDDNECFWIPNEAVNGDPIEKYGELKYVVSTTGAMPPAITTNDTIVTFDLGGSHEGIDDADMTVLVESLPQRGTLYQVDETTGEPTTAIDVFDLPASVTHPSGRLAYLAGNCSDVCGAQDQQFFQFRVNSTTIGESVNATMRMLVVSDYVEPARQPSIIVIDGGNRGSGGTVDVTNYSTVVASAVGAAGAMTAFYAAAGYRRRRARILADKYRSFWHSPHFDRASAYEGQWEVDVADTWWLKRNRGRMTALMKELLAPPHASLRLLKLVLERHATEDSDDFVRSIIYCSEAYADRGWPILRSFLDVELRAARLLPRETADNQLFRGFSNAAKMWTGYVRQGFGLKYLKAVLARPLYDVCTRNAGKVDINPDAVAASETGRSSNVNKYELLASSQRVFSAIVASVDQCPPHIKLVCKFIKLKATQGDLGADQRHAVASLVFLRFFCPAIAVPEKYGVLEEGAADEARRLLVLVAKMLQNLASNVLFGDKEEYMVAMNGFIKDNVGAMHEFIDALSRGPDNMKVSDDNDGHLEIHVPDDVRDVATMLLYEALDKADWDAINKRLVSGQEQTSVKKVRELMSKIGPAHPPRDPNASSDDEEDRKWREMRKREKAKERDAAASKAAKPAAAAAKPAAAAAAPPAASTVASNDSDDDVPPPPPPLEERKSSSGSRGSGKRRRSSSGSKRRSSAS